MKIGFDGRFIRQDQSGNGVFTQLLLEGLAHLDDDNDYTVYLLDDGLFINKDNFHLKRMSSLHSNAHLRFFLTFPLELYRNPVDIFHAIYTAPVKTSARIVLSLVEFGWFTNPEDFPAHRFFMFERRLSTLYSIRRADRIITPTRLCRDQLLEYFNLPKGMVEVVPFGFNESFLERCDPEEIDRIKRKHGITGDYILSVGDLHPRKNVTRLIDAFIWLKETRRIPHQLVLVGKELWKAEGIFLQASSGSARDSIVFTGYVTLEELRALYQGATLFAFPSLDEGFGLPVHEAMASRLPVMVSDRGALPEVAGEAALVVDPLNMEEIGHAVFRVLESPTLREELIRKGLEQIKGFSWEASCRKILHLYRDLC